jgi:MFS family permease
MTRVARQLIAGRIIMAVGNGLVVPLTLIYLNQVRGIPLAVIGTLLAAMAVVSLGTVPFAGTLLDRVGARPVLVGAIAGQALAAIGLMWVHSTATALCVLVLQGAALGPSFPAFSMLTAGIDDDPERQQRVFAISFTWMNAAIGVGAAIGALVANVRDLASFQAMFAACAVLELVACVIIARLPNVRPPAHEPEQKKAGYRDVLTPRGLRSVMVATLVLSFTGYAAIDAGLPAYASVVAGVSVKTVALALTVNTAVIVVAQLFVLKLVRRLRRSRALALIGLVWGMSWAVFGLSAAPTPAWARVALVFAFAGLFALGETVFAPTLMPLVNTLADERVRGRANAMATGTVSLAYVLSPALSTGLISAGLGYGWIALLCAGCVAVALLGVRLGGLLTPEQDTVASPSEREAADVASA